MDVVSRLDYQRRALGRLVAVLFACAGLEPGGSVSTLPRSVRSMVLGVLRPAESALRRLIYVRALGIVVAIVAARTQSAKVVPVKSESDGSRERITAFALFDPRKRFGHQRRRYAAGPGPRISYFDGFDPPREAPSPPPTPDDALDAAQIGARLTALQAALDDLPGQALRLARALARRKRSRRLRLIGPRRPGFAPGHRTRPRGGMQQEAAAILHECDVMALRAVHAHDTS